MQRKTTSADEIRAHVQGLVDGIEEARADGVKILIYDPLRHPADQDGCNWDMYTFRNATAYGFAVRQCVDQVRAKFNLSPEG